LWRRWPGEPLASSEPQQKPENVPPPAVKQGKKPSAAGNAPDTTDDMPIAPDQPSTRRLPESTDEDTGTSPALPRDLDQDLEQPSMDEDLRNQLPTEDPGDSAPEPMTPDTEPDSLVPETTVPKSTEPDELNEDPFKDDELPDGDTSETAPHSSADQVTRFSGDRDSAIRWRSPRAAAPKRLEHQPELLHADATKTARPKRIMNEVKTVTTRNPLRPNAAPARRILPTAEWATETEAASSGGQWRTNPLRSR
jgi:hypothetical protein